MPVSLPLASSSRRVALMPPINDQSRAATCDDWVGEQRPSYVGHTVRDGLTSRNSYGGPIACNGLRWGCCSCSRGKGTAGVIIGAAPLPTLNVVDVLLVAPN